MDALEVEAVGPAIDEKLFFAETETATAETPSDPPL